MEAYAQDILDFEVYLDEFSLSLAAPDDIDKQIRDLDTKISLMTASNMNEEADDFQDDFDDEL